MLTIYLGTVFKNKNKNTECQLAFEVLDLCQKVSIPVTAEENNDFRQWWHGTEWVAVHASLEKHTAALMFSAWCLCSMILT